MHRTLRVAALLIVIVVCVVPHVTHASVPFFGPIIPDEVNRCAAGYGLLMQVINNIIQFVITIVIAFITPLVIAYAGFLYVVSPTNLGNREKANNILMNLLVGVMVALGAWLIVDAVMAVFYNPGSVGATWTELIRTDGDPCLISEESLYDPIASGGGVTDVTTNGANGTNTVTGANGTSECDGSLSASKLFDIGDVTIEQAHTFSCLAAAESTCGSTLPNFNWGKGSSAYGAFQVLLSTNSECYEDQICYDAAKVEGPLNCASGFSNGNPKSDPASQQIVSQCKMAAASNECSFIAARCVLKENGGNFSPWTRDINGNPRPKQSACAKANGQPY